LLDASVKCGMSHIKTEQVRPTSERDCHSNVAEIAHIAPERFVTVCG
jgi:hypothetical protein